MGMDKALQELPIGIHSFESIRGRNYLYVDKTAKIQRLIESGERYFLSRPRRFGKSLTLSTLDAMFNGKAELFRGLAAEEWVTKQTEQPAPVLRFDMSAMKSDNAVGLENTLVETIYRTARKFKLALSSKTMEGLFQDLLYGVFEARGPVVVLIDEYDSPMLNNIGNLNAANEMRQVLRAFYTVLKSCDEYLRFVMLTGISKFSKTGVFSAMNNLQDISMVRKFGDIVGYTQDEFKENFSGWIDDAAAKMKLDREELLKRLKDYYNGFCFDGETKLYNPFSMMQCLSTGEISNYWYTSGSSTFIVMYMKQHGIKDPAEYRHIEVPKDFADSHEIEASTPESFLYQAGYLTIEEKREDSLVLDYPNDEVRVSLVRMYLDDVYHVKNYITLGTKLWQALSQGDIEETVSLYNIALSGIPYADFANQGELFYRSLFLMLLRGASITANGEVPTNLGRSDVLIQFPRRVIVLEFKYAEKSSEIERKRTEGERQIREKNYAKPYDAENRRITAAVIVIDGEKRKAVL